VLLVCLLALIAPSGAAAGTMFVGAAEDQARSLDPVVAKSRMDLAALAGFDAVRMTTLWSPGQREVGGDELRALTNAGAASQLDGIRLVLSVYNRDARTTPATPRQRADFAAFTASIARKVPAIDDFVIGNEPNLNLFWMPQFTKTGGDAAAVAYEKLLAQTYDALKRVSPDVNVIGGALAPRGQDKPTARRQTHSPSAFIVDLGKAYRKTHRRKRIMDMLALHPYAISSKLAPTFANPHNTSLGISDYDKLRRLLTRAFQGTPQPGFGLPILYDEFGYQSKIPARKQRFYRHLHSTAARDAVSEARQAASYSRAFAIAQCQPTVVGMLIFHVADERDARAWQSGVYYADNSRKSSFGAVRSAAMRAQRGTLVTCKRAKLGGDVGNVAFHNLSTSEKPSLDIDFRCASVCRYEARIVNSTTGALALSSSGTTSSGPQTATLPAAGLDPGTYQYAFRAVAAGRAGTALARFSRPFVIPALEGEPEDPQTPSLVPRRVLSSLPLLPSLLATVPAREPAPEPPTN
jgi:hypothetical protein